MWMIERLFFYQLSWDAICGKKVLKTNVTFQREMDEYKGSRTLSKVKYYEVEEKLKERYDVEAVEGMLSILRSVLKFDPAVSNYNEKMKAATYNRRARLKEAGISTYVSSGMKSYYEKHRAREEVA